MNKAIKILLSTNGLVLLSAAMIGPIYAVYSEEIGGDLLTASTSWAVFCLTAGIAVFLIGKFVDGVREQELAMMFGYFIISLGFLGYLFVKTPIALFIVQIIIGLGEALYAPAFDATYSKHLVTKKAASLWGTWEAMNYFAMAIGAFFGGLIVNFFGFPILFILMFILTFSSAVFIYFLPRKVL